MPDTPAWWNAVSAPSPADASSAAAPAPAGGESVEGYIRRAAAQRGIDPDTAIRVAQGEGGLVPNRTGSFATGKSFWPFQLHYGGAGTPYAAYGDVAGMGNSFTAKTGWQPGDPNAWQAATDYALDAAKQSGWGAWYGARNQGITGYQGINRGAGAPGPPGGAPLSQGPSTQPATPAYVASSAGSQPAWWAAVSAPAAAPASAQPARAPGSPVTADAAEQAKPGTTPQWLQLAQTQLGKPYIWGSAGGRSDFSLTAPGYDCSGFVATIMKNAFGVSIPAFTGNAYPATKAVDQQEAQPGDLVFWNMNTPDPRRQHVALYIGGGKVIQSGGAGDGVNIAPVTQMPGAEFRRSPAAYAVYGGGGGAPGRQLPATAPEQPQTLTLQGAAAPSWWAALPNGAGR